MEVAVDLDGITRADGEVRRLAWADLARIDGQEFAPNLTLHPKDGPRVTLFPWHPEHDPEAERVSELVLERAAAAGVDTTQRPLDLWRFETRAIDWDRAILPPRADG